MRHDEYVSKVFNKLEFKKVINDFVKSLLDEKDRAEVNDLFIGSTENLVTLDFVKAIRDHIKPLALFSEMVNRDPVIDYIEMSLAIGFEIGYIFRDKIKSEVMKPENAPEPLQGARDV